MTAFQMDAPLDDPGIAPQTTDQENFDPRADFFLGTLSKWGAAGVGQLNVFRDKANLLSEAVNGYSEAALAAQSEAEAQAVLAAASATAADNASNATAYDPGKVGGYAVGVVVYSATGPSYRCIQDQAEGAIQALSEIAYWAPLGTVSTTGGADIASDTADVLLAASMKKVQYRSQSALGRFYTLPAGSTLGIGFGTVVVHNTGNFMYGYKDNDGNFLCSIAPGKSAILNLIDATPGVEVWKVVGDAELLMNRLKTVCQTSSAGYRINSCELSENTVLLVFKGGSGYGYCNVMTWVPETQGFTFSNTLTFTTDVAPDYSCCRLSDTVGAIAFAGLDSDGYICAVTFNGVDTISLTHTFEFRNNDTVSSIKICSINEPVTKIAIFYTYVSNILAAQSVTWDGSVFSDASAQSQITAGSNPTYTNSICMSGSANSGQFVVNYASAGNKLLVIAWSGSDFTSGSAYPASSLLGYDSGLIRLNSDHFVLIHREGSSYDNIIAASLYKITGTTVIKKRTLFLHAFPELLIQKGQCVLLDSTHIGVHLRTQKHQGDFKLFKIKVVVADNENDCVLMIESTIDMAGYARYGQDTYNESNLQKLGSKHAVVIYNDGTNSGYLTAEKIEVA